MKIVIFLSACLVSTPSFAQFNNKDYNSLNNWHTPQVSVEAGEVDGLKAAAPRVVNGVTVSDHMRWMPTGQFNAENLRGSGLGNSDGLVNIQIGNSPNQFFRLRYVLTPAGTATTDNKVFFYVPLLGDMRINPGQNIRGYKIGDNTTVGTTLIGVGYMGAGRVGATNRSSFRGSIAGKYVIDNEMLSPDHYTVEGMTLNNRKISNGIDVKGLALEANAQLSIMNKLLLGIGGQGATYKQIKADRADETLQQVNYYDYEGNLFARVRIVNHSHLTLDLDAQCYMRMTNLNDLRQNVKRAYPKLGIRVGF